MISLPLYFPSTWTQLLGLPPHSKQHIWYWIVVPNVCNWIWFGLARVVRDAVYRPRDIALAISQTPPGLAAAKASVVTVWKPALQNILHWLFTQLALFHSNSVEKLCRKSFFGFVAYECAIELAYLIIYKRITTKNLLGNVFMKKMIQDNAGITLYSVRNTGNCKHKGCDYRFVKLLRLFWGLPSLNCKKKKRRVENS